MITNKNFFGVCLLCLSLFSAIGACGCGGPGDSGPKPEVEEDRLKTATAMRALFDKAKGDYSALSPEDKAAFDKMAKKEPEKVFNSMKSGPHSESRPPTTGG